VLDAIAINAAIVGLRASQFRSHLMRKRPKTIQHIYEEFEKYCRSDNDFRMYMEEQSHQKKSTKANLLTVDYRIKVHMDLQADKSTVVVKGPFFPRVVNPRYRIRETMCNARIQSSKARKAIL
jgi:hypothetical protein